LKLSGLPHHKTLDDFDFAFQPGLDARKVRDLATLEFVPAPSNIALLGPPGVGKTVLAVALAVAACQAGFSIYFTTRLLPPRWTTWFAGSAPPKPSAGSIGNCRPTCGPRSWSVTKSESPRPVACSSIT
jgi:hypothetical protein